MKRTRADISARTTLRIEDIDWAVNKETAVNIQATPSGSLRGATNVGESSAAKTTNHKSERNSYVKLDNFVSRRGAYSRLAGFHRDCRYRSQHRPGLVCNFPYYVPGISDHQQTAGLIHFTIIP
jgi:hypothetical protein